MHLVLNQPILSLPADLEKRGWERDVWEMPLRPTHALSGEEHAHTHMHTCTCTHTHAYTCVSLSSDASLWCGTLFGCFLRISAILGTWFPAQNLSRFEPRTVWFPQARLSHKVDSRCGPPPILRVLRAHPSSEEPGLGIFTIFFLKARERRINESFGKIP